MTPKPSLIIELEHVIVFDPSFFAEHADKSFDQMFCLIPISYGEGTADTSLGTDSKLEEFKVLEEPHLYLFQITNTLMQP